MEVLDKNMNTNIDTIYHELGGVNMNIGAVTWPFVRLTISTTSISITTFPENSLNNTFFNIIFFHIYIFAKIFGDWNKTYTIPFSEIDAIQIFYTIPNIAGGIRIIHHANAPGYLVFSSFKINKLAKIIRSNSKLKTKLKS